MRVFAKVNKMFIKSDNSTTKIFNRYLYGLIPFILLIIIYNLIWGDKIIIINLLKSIGISLCIGLITGYICNLIKKEKDIKRLFFKDHILIISIIIGLFSYDVSFFISIMAVSVAVIMRMFLKNTTISSCLYGIFIILLINSLSLDIDTPLSNLSKLSYVGSYEMIFESYGNIISYLFGLNYYLSPILSVLVFLYLFLKKSIKYNIVVAYLLTFSFIMLIFGMFNDMNTWYLLFQLCTGNILFLTIFCLTDYPNTPIIYEGQVIYGIILGIITAILRFIIPELSIVLGFILGSLIISKLIDKISIKMKYNRKLYYLILSICLLVVIITSVILIIVY